MSPISLAQQWSLNAQQQARRNAMVALTQCTQRRAEREEVERFLAARAGVPAAETLDTSISLHA
ncbi:hypothetical protein ASE01_10410 [Nocardioides sp. Root190]|uniref:hypothetical protein n=1 Tax=Nocardioides sp. Root190 TaxID=1736488 RepID=UPI0006F583D2|nr:hypothetical protein [Nocardioides sp. Root190]KRB77150.1 hypothetical protein ASE01_10410 [Nocardioides sp. Root190]